jgi:hypothetical protein
MATVSGNDLTTGLRGKVGQMMVFRVMHGKTFVSRAPRRPDKRKETAAQRKTRVTFKEASQWAKAMLVNPTKKEYYQQRAKDWNLTNAYTAAVKDYMRNKVVARRYTKLNSDPQRNAFTRSSRLEARSYPSVPQNLLGFLHLNMSGFIDGDKLHDFQLVDQDRVVLRRHPDIVLRKAMHDPVFDVILE